MSTMTAEQTVTGTPAHLGTMTTPVIAGAVMTTLLLLLFTVVRAEGETQVPTQNNVNKG